MTIKSKAYLAIFETKYTAFDAEKAFKEIEEIADGDVWNFITGAYVFKSELTYNELTTKILNEDKSLGLIFEFDPRKVNGKLPNKSWDSWFLNIFLENLHEIGEYKGWSKETTDSLIAESDTN